METTTQGQQPATETATAQVQENPDVASNPIELPLDPAEIAAALAKTKETTTDQTAGEEEDKKKPGTEEAATTEEETPEVVEDPDADLVIEGEQETPVKRILPNRISTVQFNDVEKEAIALRRELKESGDDVSLKEAIEIVEHRRAQKPAVEQQQEQHQETQTQETDALGALTTKRAELMQQRRQVAEVDPFDPALVDLDTQLEAVRDDIAETRAFNKLQQQQQQEQAARGKEKVINAREDIKQQALSVYPSAGDDKSPLGREVAKVIAEMSDPSHPDHAVLFATKAPKLVIDEAVERIADRVSKARGVTREQVIASLRAKPTESSSTSAVQTTQTTTRPAVRPVSGARQTDPAQKTLTGQELLDEVGFDPKKIAAAQKALLGKTDSEAWVVR